MHNKESASVKKTAEAQLNRDEMESCIGDPHDPHGEASV